MDRRSALLALLAASLPAHAGSMPRWREVLPEANLLGSGDLKIFGFRIYSAKLWSASREFDVAGKFALELTYHRSITRERFVEISLKEMRRLQGKEISEEALARWKTYMEGAFTDVVEGQQLIGVQLPGTGCRFYNQERLLAEIRDPAFSQAFFAIWFDARSKDAGLRSKLMGRTT